MKARDFKYIAKEALSGNWFIACIAGFLASILGGLTNNISINFGSMDIPLEEGEDVTASLINQLQYSDMINTFLVLALGIAFVWGIIMFVIGSAVWVGYSEFNLDLVNGSSARLISLFSHFDRTKDAICTRLLAFVRIFLGTLLFVIPGIVMSYSYAMAGYVLAENPGLTAREALAESKRIMKGNRFRFFCLQIRFFGWALLGIITLGIALIWVVPYQQAAFAVFYREVNSEA